MKRSFEKGQSKKKKEAPEMQLVAMYIGSEQGKWEIGLGR